MKYFILLLTVIMTSASLSAQTRVPNMMETSLTKIRSSGQAGRVIERTFSDIIFRDDSSATNTIFTHRFSSSNNYRINAFAPSSELTDIYVYIYRKDDNGKWQKVASSTSGGNDVVIRFSPQVSGSYTFLVKGTLKSGINNSLFNLIIERE